MPKRSEKRDFTQCKELVSPSKKRLENRATSREEGEDVPGPSSGEDTLSKYSIETIDSMRSTVQLMYLPTMHNCMTIFVHY